MSIFDVFKKAPGPFDSNVKLDLQRKSNLPPDVVQKAINYVLKGEDGTVLSSLSLANAAQYFSICNAYQNDNAIAIRRRTFTHAHPYPHDLVVRYGEVLAAILGPATDNLPGSAAVPPALRVVFGEAFAAFGHTYNRKPDFKLKPGEGLTLETAFALVAQAGSGRRDLIDIAYCQSSGWSAPKGETWRQQAGFDAVLASDADLVATTARTLPAAARQAIIADLTRLKFVETDAYLTFLMEQSGDASKGVREAAAKLLLIAPAAKLEPLAAAGLVSGPLNVRVAMVNVLAHIGTPSARATLEAHRKTEKTAKINAAIDNAFAMTAAVKEMSGDQPDSAAGYTSVDGTWIAIPPLKPLEQGEPPEFSPADRAQLKALLDQENARRKATNENNARQGWKWKETMLSDALIDQTFRALTGTENPASRGAHLLATFPEQFGHAAIARLPPARRLRLAVALMDHALFNIFGDWDQRPPAVALRDWLNGPDGDLRHLDALAILTHQQFRTGGYHDPKPRDWQNGDLIRQRLADGTYSGDFGIFPPSTTWPMIAENFASLDQAMGLAPSETKLNRLQAVTLLSLLPATPLRYIGPLLEVATSPQKLGRAEARALLEGEPQVEPRLVALLDDARQDVRAGAAEWLAQRRDPSAPAALRARLKKENSELARAAIVSALQKLGEDISGYVGPAALIDEAKKGLKSVKLTKLDWIGLDHLPRLAFRDGTAVPPEVARFWLGLAVKLKQPGGNGLFNIYLDQLDPKDAQAFSGWVLDSWINYDTARRSDADANAEAARQAPAQLAQYQRWQPGMTLEQLIQQIKSGIVSTYLNSGADTKGLLGFAVRAEPSLIANRVRAYLKAHGKRTSQASALLDMAAGAAHPVTLQVVIAAATRLKQKGVQQFARDLVQRVADERDWSLDELADNTIPVAGFDDDGKLELPCGEDEKLYLGTLDDSLNLIVRNPAGKTVSALPAGDDENTKESKKLLSSAKKEVKQVISMQTERLYEALCAGRSWSVADWQRNFHDHPIMTRLIQRLVWEGVDETGVPAGSFRATAEGDFTDADDAPVDLSRFASLRIAHGATLPEAAEGAWVQHLADYEVKPLFAQFGRTLMALGTSPEDAARTTITDREGWLTDAFTIRGAAGKLGWERGPAEDGGWFREYTKNFPSAGLVAVIEFTGNGLPEENIPAALVSLSFRKTGRNYAAVKLATVPPVLLSECWNDYYAFAAKAAYDAEWKKKAAW